jgi:hypothetical protein
MALRVAQWSTGKVGKYALRGVIDHSDLDLVAVHAFSPDKVGQDAGALCGRPETGVRATGDIAALIAARPDVVVYTPFTGEVDDVAMLLESGINVLSTNLFFHVGGIAGAVRDRLEGAAHRGGASLYITGINPGWINAIAVALTGVCGDVDCVSIYESSNCATYESPETWNYLRMGQHGVTPEVVETAKTWLAMFRDAVERMAEGLGLELDGIEFYCDYATAAERVDLGWFVMEQGTNAALRAGWNGKVAGRTMVRAQVTWYLTQKLAEDWTLERDEYHVVVEGAPGIDLRMRFSYPPPSPPDGEWESIAKTSFATINAIPQIAAAPPGVLTLLDMGLPQAPVGAWQRSRQ